jgi:hypothetical protein
MKVWQGRFMSSTASSRLYYTAFEAVIFFVAASASFFGYFQKVHFLDWSLEGQYGGTFQTMMDGTADRPWVYRRMLPVIGNWVGSHIPDSTQDRFYNFKAADGRPLREHFFQSTIANDRQYFVRYAAIYITDLLFAWLATYAMYRTSASLGFERPIASLAAIIMVLMMPYVIAYFYDFPELAFLALATWVAIDFDWWWLIPVCALATWNKESFLLFIPALYPFIRGRVSRKQALIGICVLLAAALAVYVPVHMRFQNNPGGTVLMRFDHQILWTRQLSKMFGHDTTYGILTLTPYNPLCLAFIAWTAWRQWGHLPKVARSHARIAFAVNIPLYFLFCEVGELRDLSLLYVTMLLLIAQNLRAWNGQLPLGEVKEQSKFAQA